MGMFHREQLSLRLIYIFNNDQMLCLNLVQKFHKNSVSQVPNRKSEIKSQSLQFEKQENKLEFCRS